MKQFDVKCPVCGKINRNLFLEETKGLLECANCGKMFLVSNMNAKESMFLKTVELKDTVKKMA